MDVLAIINDAMLVLNAAQRVFQVGMDVAPRIETAIEILEGKKALTDEERAALLADQKTYEDKIDAAVASDEVAAAASSSIS